MNCETSPIHTFPLMSMEVSRWPFIYLFYTTFFSISFSLFSSSLFRWQDIADMNGYIFWKKYEINLGILDIWVGDGKFFSIYFSQASGWDRSAQGFSFNGCWCVPGPHRKLWEHKHSVRALVSISRTAGERREVGSLPKEGDQPSWVFRAEEELIRKKCE